VTLQDIDVVAGRQQDDMEPVVTDGCDVGLPVEVARPEREVRLQQVVLHDIRVLPGHQLEDLLGGIQVTSPSRPGATPTLGAR